MSLRSLLFALLCVLAAAGAARADDWTIQSVEGAANVFTNGAWGVALIGADLPENAMLETTSDGRLAILRGADSVDLAPSTKLRVEGDNPLDAVTREFEGVVGVDETASLGKRFLFVTPHASILAKGAVFGVAADAHATTIHVLRGLVSVTDMVTQKTADLTDGQALRVTREQTSAQQAVPADDPVSAAARDAAERAAAVLPADKRDEAAKSAAAASANGDIDPKAVGSVEQSADGKAAQDAADAAHAEKRKAKLGKADPRAVAAVKQIESDLTEGVDVETEPLDDNFQWTEVENGEVRLKPLSRIILGLHGSEAYEFWGLWLVACLMLGYLTNAVMMEASLGAGVNTLVVMAAFASAIVLRDAFFRAGDNLSVEPFLSIGLMLGAMPLALLGGAFAKLRLD